MFDVIKLGSRLMEVTEIDSQRIKRGKEGRKKCRFTFSTRFKLLAYLKNRDLREISSTFWLRRQKSETLTILSTSFGLGLKLQASNHSFLLLDTFVEQPPKYWFTLQTSASPRKHFLDFEVI